MDDVASRIRNVIHDIFAAPIPDSHRAAMQQYLHPCASLTTSLFTVDSSTNSRDNHVIPTLQTFRDVFPDCSTEVLVVSLGDTREQVFIKMKLGIRPCGISDETLKGFMLWIPCWVRLHLQPSADNALWTIDQMELVVLAIHVEGPSDPDPRRPRLILLKDLLRVNGLGRLLDTATYLSWSLITLIVATYRSCSPIGPIAQFAKRTSSFLLWRPACLLYMANIYLCGVMTEILIKWRERMQQSTNVLRKWRWPQIIVREVENKSESPRREVVRVREIKGSMPREHIIHLREIKGGVPPQGETRTTNKTAPPKVKALVRRLENE